MKTIEIPIEGMTCGGCARSVERALRGVPGVEAVEVRLEPGAAEVRGEVEKPALEDAIRKAGFVVPAA